MPMKTENVNSSTQVCTKFLPFELSYIPDDMRKKAKAELFEDEDTRVNSLRLLRTMLKDEKDLYWQDDDYFLLAFLRARKFDVKRAFNLMRNFYTVKAKHYELYDNFDFQDVKDAVRDNTVGFLPYRDEEGCAILVLSTSTWNPTENPLSEIMRALTTGLLEAIQSPATQIAGFKVIVDFNAFTIRHVPHVSPTYLWLFAEALQNCFPGRFRAVHVVNEGHLFTYVWSILKQLLTKKLRERFHFHGKNVKKLHKYFSPSILPAEYDGDLPRYSNREWVKQMELSATQLTENYAYGYKMKNKEKN